MTNPSSAIRLSSSSTLRPAMARFSTTAGRSTRMAAVGYDAPMAGSVRVAIAALALATLASSCGKGHSGATGTPDGGGDDGGGGSCGTCLGDVYTPCVNG